MSGDRQRIDRWLWHARVVKTREQAKALVESGHVRVDRARETKAGAPIRAGQVLTVTLPSRVRVLRVVDFVEQRGTAEAASRLYEDLSPPPPAAEQGAEAEPVGSGPSSAGRPTKRERREIIRFVKEDENGA